MLVAHRGPDFFKRFKIEFALFDGKRREIAFLRKVITALHQERK